MSHQRLYWISAITAIAISAAVATAPSVFVPDSTFRGSSLAGWHTLGKAQWRAENGELIANAAQGGGWLILDKSYQDVGFFASFRCAAGCEDRRAAPRRKDSAGHEGRIHVSDRGRRGCLPRDPGRAGAGTFARETPVRRRPDARRPARHRRCGRRGGGAAAAGGGRPTPQPPGVTLPIVPPRGAYRAANGTRSRSFWMPTSSGRFFNDGGSGNHGRRGGRGFGRYGPIALYAGGPGEVRFKDVAYKDLGAKVLPQEQVSSHFRMQQHRRVLLFLGGRGRRYQPRRHPRCGCRPVLLSGAGLHREDGKFTWPAR